MVNAKPIEKGTRFWKLVTLWEVWHIWTYVAEKCLCDCWTVKWITRNHLRRWATKSCWCLLAERARESMAKMNTKHWMFWTRIYDIYLWVRGRCYNKNYPGFFRYWGRGIKCEWNNFEDFYKDMWESYDAHVKEYWEKETTIDRIDSNWNYCKDNCRRATHKEQANNMRTTRFITYKWDTLPLTAMCEKYNVKYDVVRNRLTKWWDVIRAIEEPINIKFRNKNAGRKQKEIWFRF